ncbi:hypothetical protein B484DRAFT_24626 [Ochromonadaceae sp. CCMP2298]|nr:hypothetical protein B484DRAFT_24626 [Ochromonadaceae sp. CCMP2298]
MSGAIPEAASLLGRRVAIFGSSANPPTGTSGHVGIVRHMVKSGLFDELWVLPVYQHMFAAKRHLEAFEHRVQMCRLCMEPESTSACRVRVLEVEREAAEALLPKGVGRVGTVDVLDFICEKLRLPVDAHADGNAAAADAPAVDGEGGSGDRLGGVDGGGLQLHLLLGSDTFRDLASRKWKQADRIMKMATVHVILRRGHPLDEGLAGTGEELVGGLEEGAEGLDGLRRVTHRPLLGEVSSSEVRALLEAAGGGSGGEGSGGGDSRDRSRDSGGGADHIDAGQQGQGGALRRLGEVLRPSVLAYIQQHRLYGCAPVPDTPTDTPPPTLT